MTRESDLLFGLLAMQMNFISRDQLLECAAVWMNDPGTDLEKLVLERKFITPPQHAVVKALAEQRLKLRGGDPEQPLATAVSPKTVMNSPLALNPPTELARTIVSAKAAPDQLPAVNVSSTTENRYRIGRELGRGGLGQVVEAYDSELERSVAAKLVLDDLPAELTERFVREAKLAARLEHPAIVPVYDFGAVRGEGGRKRLLLCMKKIVGRDLGKVLRAVAADESGIRKTFTRARLLRILQDVCLGMAFAHDRGVIHRDLKPANIMIGDYGETLIVDWGLARERGRAEGRTGERGNDRATPSPELTMEGEVIGTPAYMSPEQADGAILAMDRRSDVYSLGAILYEILTLRPPFEGRTPHEIIRQVQSGRITPPSQRLGEDHPDRRVVEAPSIRTPVEAVPPELDAICLKAMAFRCEDRYQTATELHDEIQLFLEGVKELERKRKEARERIEAGKKWSARYRELRDEIEAQEKAVKELNEKIRPHQKPEEKRPLWDAEARLLALREERIEAFSKSSAEFERALVLDPATIEATDERCELFLDRFLEAEKRRDREAMLLNRNALLQLDREGTYGRKLNASGRLSLRAFAYSCDCLRPVVDPRWRVEIAETCAVPWQGGRPRPDLSLTDRDQPVPAVRTFPEGVRWGHRDDCPRSEVPGVEVRIARYEERDRRLVLGSERVLGVTPLSGVELPQGSYRCTLRAPDPAMAEALLPVLIARGGCWEQDVNLYRASDIPAGFRLVSGGPFTFGGEWAGGGRAETLRTEDVFVATFPVTCAEYLDFLNELLATGHADEARSRQPREGNKKWWIDEGERFRLPTPSEDANMAWDARCPVFGVNWFDAIAYAVWRSRRDGVSYRLMHEEEYEKAARGVDGRVYPYGDVYDGGYSHTNVSMPRRFSLMPAGSFPVDESPWGLMGLSGGMATWGWNAPRVPWRSWVCIRGGAWCGDAGSACAGSRMGKPPVGVHWGTGLRLAAAAGAR